MHNALPGTGGWSRVGWLALLSLSGLACLSAAEKAVPLPVAPSMAERRAEMQRREDNYVFELVGVGAVADEPVAILAVNGQLCSVRAGFDLWGRMIDEVDVTNQRVMLHRRNGTQVVLKLTAGETVKIPPMVLAQREFLLSKEGGRRTLAVLSETGYGSRWVSLPREKQAEILVRHLDQGVIMGGLKDEGYRGWLFDRQWAQLRKEKHNAFLNSLSADQRAAYTASARPAVRLGGPPPDRAQIADGIRAAEMRRQEVVASLTPAQRALYDDLQSWIRLSQ